MAATNQASKPAREPESLLDIGKQLLTGFLKSLPKRIVMMAIIFVVVWVAHTFLVVVGNEGFNPSDFGPVGLFLGQILALSGRLAGGTFFWFLASFTLSMAIAGMSEKGGGFFAGLGRTPAMLGAAFGADRLPALLGGAATGALISAWLFNRFDALLIALLALVAMAHGPKGFLHTIVRCGYNDGRRILSKPKRRLPTIQADSFLAGVAVASLVFMISIFIPRFVVWFLAVALLVVAIVVATQRSSAAVTGIFGVLAFGLAMAAARAAFGDDGGASEAVGPWITSEGALTAILMGLPPSVAAALGASLGPLATGPWAGIPGLAGFPVWGGAEANPGLVHDPAGGGPGDCQRSGLPVFAVDTAELRFSVSDTLYAAPGPLMRPLAHVWNANGELGPFGRGWRFSFSERITDEGDSLRLIEGSGAITEFEAPASRADGAIAKQRGGDATLRAYQGGWVAGAPGSRSSAFFEPAPAGGFRLSSIYDPEGNAVRVAYDTNGRLERITDPGGRAYALGYDAIGYCTSITLPDGRAARYTYSPAGDLATAVDLAGVESHYTYDAGGLLVRVEVGRERNTTQIQWTSAPWGSCVAQVTDAGGGVTRYGIVSDEPRETFVTDPAGRTKRYTSEGGKTARVVSPSGATGTVERTPDGIMRATDPTGAVSTYETDPAGRWRRETDADGTQRVFHYDEAGFLIRVDVPGGSWSYQYDASHRPIATQSPGGRRWTYEYDQKGNLASETDPAGSVARYEYDRFGNPVTYTDATGATGRLEYDEHGLRLLRAHDPLGNTMSWEYDANDRVTKTTKFDGTVEETLHGCCAPLVERDGAGDSVGFDRDAMLRPTRITDRGRVSEFRYDAAGAITEATDAGVLTRLAYDSDGRLSRIETPDGVRELGYDAAGRVTWSKDPAGGQTWFHYDATGRRTGFTDSLGRRTAIEFDGMGNPVRGINARGQEVRAAYDADGKPLSLTVDGAQYATFELDARGGLAGFQDRTGSTALATDPVGRVTSITYPDGAQLAADTNATGNVTRLMYPGGLAVDLTLNAANRPVRIAFGAHSVELGYDAAGRLAREERSNGVTSTYEFSGEDMTGLEHRGSAGIIASARYQVDQVTGRTIAESGHRPAKGTLGSAPRALSFDDAGGLAAVNGATARTDADGNVVAVDGHFEATYDHANRLTRLSVDGTTTEYDYDAIGRLAATRRDGKTTTYYRDMTGRLLAEGDGAGGITAWYVWAEDLLVARVDADGEVGFYLGDRQGSTLALVDGSGNVAAAYDYGPWGMVTAREGEVDQPFTWQGRSGVTDEGAGIFAVGPRTFLATAGRFMQRDPAYPLTGWNPYAYADGNPVDFVDSTGFDSARSAWNARNNPPKPPPSDARSAWNAKNRPSGPGPDGPINKAGVGLLNMGAGAIGTGLGIVKVITLVGTAGTPVGWTVLAVGGTILAIGRFVAGAGQVRAGLRGEKFANSEEAVIDAIDPAHARKLPGKGIDWVCGKAGEAQQGYNNFRDKVGRGLWQLNQPETWMQGLGGY